MGYLPSQVGVYDEGIGKRADKIRYLVYITALGMCWFALERISKVCRGSQESPARIMLYTSTPSVILDAAVI